MPVRFDITAQDGLFKGTDKPVQINVVDEAGEPVDMDGWGLEYVLKRHSGAPPLFTKSVDDGIAITEGAGPHSRAVIAYVPADTATLTAGIYWHALYRTDQGARDVLSYGDVVLREAGLTAPEDED